MSFHIAQCHHLLPLLQSSHSTQIDVLFVKLTVLFINMRTLKLKSHLHNCVFCCRQSITIISNKPWNSETHKRDWNPPITNLKPRPFEPIRVKFCFLRGPIKMIDSSEKGNHPLAFELQNSQRSVFFFGAKMFTRTLKISSIYCSSHLIVFRLFADFLVISLLLSWYFAR